MIMKLHTASVLIILVFLSSCAFYSGTTSSNVTYNGNNAEIIDIVSAKNSVTRIFGIGGLDKEALILETKRKMYHQNPLKKGQVYANIGIDVKQAFYLIADVTTVTVSADVLLFYNDSTEHKVFFKLNNQTASLDRKQVIAPLSFTEGQSIYFLSNNEVKTGKIQSVFDDQLRISTSGKESFYVDKAKSFYKSDLSDPSSLERVSFKDGETTIQGYVVGYNEKSFVVKHKEQLSVIKKKFSYTPQRTN